MEATNSFLIDLTSKEISKGYVPGTLKWIKQHRPMDWTRLLVEERRINEAALNRDLRALKRALDSYQKVITTLSKEFKRKEETTNG